MEPGGAAAVAKPEWADDGWWASKTRGPRDALGAWLTLLELPRPKAAEAAVQECLGPDVTLADLARDLATVKAKVVARAGA